LQISGHTFTLMDVLNVNYNQDDIHLKKWDAYSLIRQKIQFTLNPKADNAQHVPKIVEFNDFDTKKTKVTEIQPLKCLKKTLLSLKAYE